MTLSTNWTLQEDAGGTAYDARKPATGTINGATQGATGILGTTSYSFDGTDDSIAVPEFVVVENSGWTLSSWVKIDNHKDKNVVYQSRVNGQWWVRSNNAGEMVYGWYDGSNAQQIFSSAFNTGEWIFITAVWNPNGDAILYINGKEEGRLSTTTVAAGDMSEASIGADRRFSQFYLNGNIELVRLHDHILTPSEVQHMYEASQKGAITTGVKSLGSSGKPDLQNLDYTLNSQSITLYVVGSPGTSSEEVVKQSLNGSSSYSLSWSNSHTDFRIHAVLETTDVTTSPELRKIGLAVASQVAGITFDTTKNNITLDPTLGDTTVKTQ